MVAPASSTSRVAVRAMFLIGDTQRSISSTAPGMSPSGSAVSRASWLPRQKWAPNPKARWGLGERVMSKVSGSSKTLASRLADG